MRMENTKGLPCLTIFSAPNSSGINEQTLNKKIITKQEMIKYGYQDVRTLLESEIGIDVYSDGPRGQKTSVFMRYKFKSHSGFIKWYSNK